MGHQAIVKNMLEMGKENKMKYYWTCPECGEETRFIASGGIPQCSYCGYYDQTLGDVLIAEE